MPNREILDWWIRRGLRKTKRRRVFMTGIEINHGERLRCPSFSWTAEDEMEEVAYTGRPGDLRPLLARIALGK